MTEKEQVIEMLQKVIRQCDLIEQAELHMSLGDYKQLDECLEEFDKLQQESQLQD